MLEFNGKAGDKSPMHSHPDHVIYIVTGGKARFTLPDGKTQEIESKAGRGPLERRGQPRDREPQ